MTYANTITEWCKGCYFVKAFDRYLDLYKKYGDLLNKAGEIEVSNFIKEDHALDDYVKMILRYEVLTYLISY